MKNGGRIPWDVNAICETYKISCLMGRHLMSGGSDNHVKAPLSRIERWYNVTLFLLKTGRDCINSARKATRKIYSLAVRYTRGESGKETFWSQTLRNWNRWTHLNLRKKTQCKGSVNAHEW